MKDDYDISKLMKTKKKRINSRTKGNTFENKVCEILNTRFNTTDFMRSPGSGAFATSHRLPEHLQIHGDLITPKDFAFTIECKKGYNKESIASIFNPKSELRSFIEQAERDSAKESKRFMIIFKQDRQNTIVIFPSIFAAIKHDYATFSVNGTTYWMMRLEEFLTCENIKWYTEQ
jgi:hypothetical protein